MKKEFITVTEVSVLEKVRTNTVYTWVKNGQLKKPIVPYISKLDVINATRPVLIKLNYKVIRNQNN